MAETKVTGYVAALSYANVYYVIRRHAGKTVAEEALRLMRGTFGLVPFDQVILDQALASDCPDFEDAIQYFSARKAQADCILTRNAGHFPAASIPVLSPEQFLATYSRE